MMPRDQNPVLEGLIIAPMIPGTVEHSRSSQVGMGQTVDERVVQLTKRNAWAGLSSQSHLKTTDKVIEDRASDCIK